MEINFYIIERVSKLNFTLQSMLILNKKNMNSSFQNVNTKTTYILFYFNISSTPLFLYS